MTVKKKRLIAVYGSLRKGEFNYDRFKSIFKNDFEYRSTRVVYGWDLFDLGSYPGIKKSDNPNKMLMVDTMEVSEECFQAINAMELGAGYEAIEVEIGIHKAIIYQYNYGVNLNNIVESGNWSVYLKAKARFKEAEDSREAARRLLQERFENAYSGNDIWEGYD